jgi:tRNA pseudouridine38-40 synthase
VARFKLFIEYNGTRYSGWQIQKNARTVQGELDGAIREATGSRGFELYGSGRTDAGVHALEQVAHLDINTNVPPETLARRVNEKLPADINVLRVEMVARRFHARHDAVARSYLYQVSRRRTAFAKPFVWWVKEPLDVALMQAAGRQLLGMQDFQSFTDADPEETSTLVLVDRLDIAEHEDLILIRVQGSHFLWKMVRRLVGVLVEVGKGSLSADDVPRFFEGRSDLPARLTAPAAGLFLERVFYGREPRDLPLTPAVMVAPRNHRRVAG